MDRIKFIIEIPFAMIQKDGCDITIHIADDGVTIDQPAQESQQPHLYTYIEQCAERLRTSGKARTADTYLSALRSFRKFRNGKDIALGELSAQIVADYQCHLLACGVQMNTVSFYMRILRTIYRHAVTEGLIGDRQPFASVYTGIAKTRKRALPSEDMQRVVACCPEDASLILARDLFLFSLYTRGMSTVDIFNLKQSDLCDGVLSYQRQKTGQRLQIAWTPEMEAIVERWPSKDGHHLLGMLDDNDSVPVRTQYQRLQGRLAYHLKKLGTQLELKHSLTMYVARHTWASTAKALGIPTNVISDAMGHNSEKTTLIYLASMDASKIDQANRAIIDSLGKVCI